MRLSEYGLRGNCIFCGLAIGQGGVWSLDKGDVVLCGDADCIEKLMHLAIDALKDGPMMGESKRQLTLFMKSVATDVINIKDRVDD